MQAILMVRLGGYHRDGKGEQCNVARSSHRFDHSLPCDLRGGRRRLLVLGTSLRRSVCGASTEGCALVVRRSGASRLCPASSFTFQHPSQPQRFYLRRSYFAAIQSAHQATAGRKTRHWRRLRFQRRRPHLTPSRRTIRRNPPNLNRCNNHPNQNNNRPPQARPRPSPRSTTHDTQAAGVDRRAARTGSPRARRRRLPPSTRPRGDREDGTARSRSSCDRRPRLGGSR